MSYRDKYNKRKGNFYSFKIGQSRFDKIKQISSKKAVSMFARGLFFGIGFESLIVATPTYENSVKKYTERRLETKRIENEHLRKRAELKAKKLQSEGKIP